MIIVAVNQSPQQPSEVSELLEHLNSQFIFYLFVCFVNMHMQAQMMIWSIMFVSVVLSWVCLKNYHQSRGRASTS